MPCSRRGVTRRYSCRPGQNTLDVVLVVSAEKVLGVAYVDAHCDDGAEDAAAVDTTYDVHEPVHVGLAGTC